MERSETENAILDSCLPAWGKEEKAIGDRTVAEVDELGKLLLAIRGEVEELSRQIDSKKEILKMAEEKMYSFLTFHHKDKYVFNEGSVGIIRKLSFKVPQTEEDKRQFFDWLKAKNIFWQYASVNSNSLNALVNDFWNPETGTWNEKVPGILEPKPYEKLTIYKNK